MNRAKEQVRKAIFSKLRGLRQKLNTQGIPCVYARSVLSHVNGVTGFTITVEAAGSNGDTTLLPRLSVRNGENVEEFEGSSFEMGLVRVREMFRFTGESTQSPPAMDGDLPSDSPRQDA